MILIRTFTVLAAAALVAAFTLATVLPPDLPLGISLAMLDRGLPPHLQAMAERVLPNWAWVHLALPVLARPVWLMPAALGVIFAGAAASFSSPGGPQRSRRRRS